MSGDPTRYIPPRRPPIGQYRAVREHLNATHAAARQAVDAIRNTGVNLKTRFVWAPR